MTNFQKILKTKGIQQKELAKASGLTPEMLSRFVNGKSDLTLKKAKKIADALGVKIDDLI